MKPRAKWGKMSSRTRSFSRSPGSRTFRAPTLTMDNLKIARTEALIRYQGYSISHRDASLSSYSRGCQEVMRHQVCVRFLRRVSILVNGVAARAGRGQAIAPTMLRAGLHVVHSRGDGLSSPCDLCKNMTDTLRRQAPHVFQNVIQSE